MAFCFPPRLARRWLRESLVALGKALRRTLVALGQVLAFLALRRSLVALGAARRAWPSAGFQGAARITRRAWLVMASKALRGSLVALG